MFNPAKPIAMINSDSASVIPAGSVSWTIVTSEFIFSLLRRAFQELENPTPSTTIKTMEKHPPVLVVLSSSSSYLRVMGAENTSKA